MGIKFQTNFIERTEYETLIGHERPVVEKFVAAAPNDMAGVVFHFPYDRFRFLRDDL